MTDWNPASDAEYFADPAVSFSKLKVAAESLPLYYGMYVSGEIPEPVPSKSMKLGSVCHALVLEPDRIANAIVVEPSINKRTKAGKVEHQEFLSDNFGKLIVSQEEWELGSRAAESILAHDETAELLDHLTHRETPHKWQWIRSDFDGHLYCKCKWDGVSTSSGFLLDIKTARDPSPDGFEMAFNKFKYAGQAAVYKQGAVNRWGSIFTSFYFVAVRNKPPFEVSVYRVSPESMSIGARWAKKQLDKVANGYKTGTWGEWWQRGVNQIDITETNYRRHYAN